MTTGCQGSAHRRPLESPSPRSRLCCLPNLGSPAACWWFREANYTANAAAGRHEPRSAGCRGAPPPSTALQRRQWAPGYHSQASRTAAGPSAGLVRTGEQLSRCCQAVLPVCPSPECLSTSAERQNRSCGPGVLCYGVMVAWSIIGHLAYKSRRCYRRGLPRAAAACSASGHGRGCRCLPRLLLLLLLLHLCAHERLELAAHATHKGAEAAAAVQLLQQPLQARHCRLACLHCNGSRAGRGRVEAAG